jgi:hypothetical protein
MQEFVIKWTGDKDMPMCHSYFYVPVTKSVLRRYKDEIKRLCIENNYPVVYCVEPFDDIDLNKFVTKIGFRKVRSFCKDKQFFNLYRMDTRCYK